MPSDESPQGVRRRGALWWRAVVVALLALAALVIWKLPRIVAADAQARWERDFGPTKDFLRVHPRHTANDAALGLEGAMDALDTDAYLHGDAVAIIASASDAMRSPSSKLAAALARFDSHAAEVDALVGAVLSASPLAWEEDLQGYPKTYHFEVDVALDACIARAITQSRGGEAAAAQRCLEAAWVLTQPWLTRADIGYYRGRENLALECSAICACDQAWPGWEKRLATCAPGPDIITILRADSLDDVAEVRSGRVSWCEALTSARAAELNHESAVLQSSWDACAADVSRDPLMAVKMSWLPFRRYWFPYLVTTGGIGEPLAANERLALSAVMALTRRVLELRAMRPAVRSGDEAGKAGVEPPPGLPCPSAHFYEAQLPDGGARVDVRDLPPWVEEALSQEWRTMWPNGVPVRGEPPDR